VPHWLQLMASSFWPLLRAAIAFTVPLTILSFVGGVALGLATALVRLYGRGPAVSVARFYVWLVRGTPLLVQLFLIFYGLPKVGIVLDAFPAALIGFIVCIGAYTSETIRAAISSIPKGQWEASYSIGMTWYQAMVRTVLPQAARVATPSLANTFISLVKDTSLAASLTVTELFQTSQQIAAATYEPLIVYSEAGLIYLAISSVLSQAQARLERRLDRHVAVGAPA
jgi:L-cystine transport system permease protein